MPRKLCHCGKAQAVRPGGLCNRCHATQGPITVKKDLRQLPIDEITIDLGIQARCGVCEDTVLDYEDVLTDPERGPDEFPPVVVFQEGEWFVLADGFHRYAAHRRACLDVIQCDVRQGTRRDALLYACGANAKHGLSRSTSDKRKSVAILLNDPEWGKWAEREIARAAGVSHGLVHAMRQELAEAAERASRPVAPPVEVHPPAWPARYLDPVPDGPAEDEALPARAAPEEQPRPEPAKPRKVEASEPVDGKGDDLPHSLKDVFGDGSLREATILVDRMLDLVRTDSVVRLISGKKAFFPFVQLPELTRDLDDAHNALIYALDRIQAGIPYSPCPKCHGAKCRECRNAGYVPFWRWEELKKGGVA